MASHRKEQKETDKAIRHLIDYVKETEPWAANFIELKRQMISPLAEQFGLSYEETEDELLHGPYYGHAFGYLFEDMVTAEWDNVGTAISHYLKQRGWREGVHGKRYLRALAESDVDLWQVTDVVPGEWIEVRRYNTKNKVKRVHEASTSEQVMIGDCLAARVLLLGKKRNFSGAIMPMTDEQADQIQHQMTQVEDTVRKLYQKMLDEKEIDEISEQEIQGDINRTEYEVLLSTIFSLWGAEFLQSTPPAPPQIRNTDDEAIVISKHRFALLGDQASITEILDKHFINTEANSWIWQNDKDMMVATIRITEKRLELSTNSVERSLLSIDRLQSLLGDLIGQPIGVHESLESAITNAPAPAAPLSDEALQNHPEIQQQVQDYLQKHYREALDEPIPMLDDLSPRQCAADKETREKVIHWLKNMELHNLKTGQDFDTSWMWQELGLTERRTAT